LDLPDETVVELLEELGDFESVSFRDGQWKKAKWWSTKDFLKIDFGGDFGLQSCAPMILEEMRDLPDSYPSLRNTGFFVGSFNWFVDWLVMPLAILGLKIWPGGMKKPMARLMKWGLKTFSNPPYGTLLKVEAQGVKDGQPKRIAVTLSHTDGYIFTAIPVAACLLQYLDGSIRRPGLWLQASLVEPKRLMGDMQRMGIQIQKQN
jgi:hypothetical protein